MKKSLLFVLVLAVICSIFSFAFAEDPQSSVYEPKIQPSEMTVYTVGNAFDWGTSYESVNDFLASVPNLKWHESTADRIYVSNQATHEHYYFYFHENALYQVNCLQLSGNKINADLPRFWDKFIDAYGLSELDLYTGSEELNAKADYASESLIVADSNTAYYIHMHEVEEGNREIPYTALVFKDKNYPYLGNDSENGSNTELILMPNINPAGFGKYNFGVAFDWGTDFETVADFVNQTSGYDIYIGTDKITMRTPNGERDADSVPERYDFEFVDGKLESISGMLTSMIMDGSRIPQIAEDLKYAFALQDLESYSDNERINSAASYANANYIVSDDYTIYGIFNFIESGKRLSHVDFIFTDKNKAETGISSVDAGIGRPGKDYTAIPEADNTAEVTPLENLEPSITPDEFAELGYILFGYTFDWGTDYDTVLNFASQVPGFEMETSSSRITLSTTDLYTAPEVYTFEFSNGKLDTVSGSLYTMCMDASAPASLKNIADMLKAVYLLDDFEPYTKNGRMNSQVNQASESLIVADGYTIYGLFNMVKTGNSLSSVDFIFTDKHKAETGINSADAGIARPWEDYIGDDAAEPATTADPVTQAEEPVVPASMGAATLVGNCKYGSFLSLGSKAEVVNVASLQMYSRANGSRIDGLSIWQGPELTITDGPYCLDGVVWWEVNFLGYIGWVPEMNASGTYYLAKH